MALTNDDIKRITQTFTSLFRQMVDELGLVTKEDLKYLPTKEEYFDREDKAMGKLKKIEEEMTILSGRSSHHSADRIENLEKIHPNNSHLANFPS